MYYLYVTSRALHLGYPRSKRRNLGYTKVMSKETSVFVLGIVVFFSTFLGLPTEYKEWIFIVSGALLIGIGYRLRRRAFLRSIENDSGERRSEEFVENSTEEGDGTIHTEDVKRSI